MQKRQDIIKIEQIKTLMNDLAPLKPLRWVRSLINGIEAITVIGRVSIRKIVHSRMVHIAREYYNSLSNPTLADWIILQNAKNIN